MTQRFDERWVTLNWYRRLRTDTARSPLQVIRNSLRRALVHGSLNGWISVFDTLAMR